MHKQENKRERYVVEMKKIRDRKDLMMREEKGNAKMHP